MRGGVKMGLAVAGFLLLPPACDWEEFHACEGEECTTTTSGTTATAGMSDTGGSGGADGADGAGGSAAGSGSSGDGGTGTTGNGGTASSGGGSTTTTVGGEGGEAGTGGTGGTGDGPATCDGELLPGEDACVVDEEYGVFVSPVGDDVRGDGTREEPFATLQRAANNAGALGKRVYVCATWGDYTARLTLAEMHDGLELFGSFDCSDWSYAGHLRAHVEPEVGVPLQIRDIAASLELDGFVFESADADERGTSSIAAQISDSSGVVLRNVALRSGAGAEGDPGKSMVFDYPTQSELDGGDAYENEAGHMARVECPAGDATQGGEGGPQSTSEPGDGQHGTPDHEGSGGDGGVVGGDCVGRDGRDGPDGADGAGASKRGELLDGTWVPASGRPGEHGQAGQGGGGGAGAANGGGGSGGAGGCGRQGGTGGGGGGASIALVLRSSEVTLLDSEVVATEGGNGAPGGTGEPRSPVFGSPGLGLNDGCDGGAGGWGGAGGGGGGGAGGISVGILFSGTPAVRMNTSVTAGIEGEGGVGGGADNDGVDGFSEPEFDVQDL